ncbi:MAG: Hsp20/alpha crystallin family protein [Bacilli bacterium]
MDEKNKQKEAVEYVKKQWNKVAKEVSARIDKDAIRDWVKDVDTKVQRNMFPQFPVDVAETDVSYIVRAQIAAATKDHIEVSFSENKVRIAVNFLADQSVSGEEVRWVRKEIGRAPLERIIRFARTIDEKNARATFQNGILELVIPVISPSEHTIEVE